MDPRVQMLESWLGGLDSRVSIAACSEEGVSPRLVFFSLRSRELDRGRDLVAGRSGFRGADLSRRLLCLLPSHTRTRKEDEARARHQGEHPILAPVL